MGLAVIAVAAPPAEFARAGRWMLKQFGPERMENSNHERPCRFYSWIGDEECDFEKAGNFSGSCSFACLGRCHGAAGAACVQRQRCGGAD
jgi:hypothetical protein